MEGLHVSTPGGKAETEKDPVFAQREKGDPADKQRSGKGFRTGTHPGAPGL